MASPVNPKDDSEYEPVLPAMWLHAAHSIHGSAPRSLPLNFLASSADAPICDLEDLLQVDLDADGFVVSDYPDCKVPLTFAEVSLLEGEGTYELNHDNDDERIMLQNMIWSHVLVAPRRSLGKQPDCVWIIIVHGHITAMQSLLAVAGRLGAVRFDLHSAYRLTGENIGEGGSCSVASAHATEGSIAAFKHLRWRRESFEGSFAVKTYRHEVPLDFIGNEVAMMCAVPAHPNIIGFYGLFFMNDGPHGNIEHRMVVLQACRGDVQTLVERQGPATEQCALGIATHLFAALQHIHANDLVHRDVKAENVLLDKAGQRAILSDFGLAARLSNAHEMSLRRGTPGYAPPEVWKLSQVQRYGDRLDVFSAGVVFYYILSAKLPFGHNDAKTMIVRTLRCVVPWDQPCFDRTSLPSMAILKALLKPEPVLRPPAAKALTDLKSAFKPFQETLGNMPTAEKSTRPTIA